MRKGRETFSLFFIGFLILSPFDKLYAKEPLRNPVPEVPPWVADVPIPKHESIFLVVKALKENRREAEKLEAFIQQLMGTTPGDGVDISDHYEGLPSGKYVVGMLFDTRERALWWMDFSYRNRQISKGELKIVKIKGDSPLPYMPAAQRGAKKRLVSEGEVMAVVKGLPDVKILAQKKRLQFKFTDYPRNGDLRYEIEILEENGKKDPVMVDFLLISALNGQVTERLSTALGRDILAQDP